MKKLTLILAIVALLAGCSSKGMSTIDEVYESRKVAIEKMSANVDVYTVAGTGTGVIIAQDERNKYIEVDLPLVSQHPTSLVQSSLGKIYKADLVSYNEKTNKATIHIKCSIDLNEKLKTVSTDSFKDTVPYEERIALKEKYKTELHPAQQVLDYEEDLFLYNPDELQAFVYQFEQADDKAPFIANDLLQQVISEASSFETSYILTEIESVTVQKTNIVVRGLVDFLTNGEKSQGQIIYTIVPVDNEFKMIQIQWSEK